MEIRRLDGRDDVRGLIRAHGLAWREAYDGILPEEVLPEHPEDPTEQDVERWIDRLRENRDGVLVAVDEEGTVRGFADFRWGNAETKAFVGDDEAGLKAIYVEPAYWNRGIGTALLERGLEIVPESVDTLRLETFSENDISRRFYETWGFERTGEGEHEIGGRSYPTDIYALRM